jgi:DNA-binding transcriptional LysR family regulator
LNLLVALDALLAEHSVTRAARRLRLSQPAASHALARLRELLGDPLLVRSGSRMMLTPRAEALSPKVRAALDAVSLALESGQKFDPARETRPFKLAGADFAQVGILPGLAARLAKEAPLIDVLVHPTTEDLHGLVSRGEIDLALGPIRTTGIGASLKEEPLFEERFVCIVREGHELTKKRLTLERYVEARHAMIAPRGRAGGIVDEVLTRMGLARRVAMRLPHFLVAPHVVASSDLVLTLPERIARLYEAELPIVLVRPPLELPGFTVSMVWHDRSDAAPAHAWIRRVIREVAMAVAPRHRKTSGGRARSTTAAADRAS